MKFMLASDVVEKKLKFPLIAQPKIDGVRGGNMLGELTGRSGKKHANLYTTQLFSQLECLGFDGELAAQDEHHPDLCRLTASALNTVEGQPFTLWWLFDWIHPGTFDKPYAVRLEMLQKKVWYLQQVNAFEAWGRLRVMPSVTVHTMAELNALDEKHLELGFEGTCTRDPNGMHKQGRSTATEGGLLRMKQFIEEEAIVVEIEEGQANQNEATLDPHGYTERSTHQENMVPNGMVGAMICRSLKDVVWQGKTIIQRDQLIKVAAGRMSHDERRDYFLNSHKLIGQTIKYQFSPKGIKDKPRFPTFQSIRMQSDI